MLITYDAIAGAAGMGGKFMKVFGPFLQEKQD